MDKKYLYFGILVVAVIVVTIVAVSVLPGKPAVPGVYIVYPSEKGDLSYTDSAYQGLVAAQKAISFTTKEFMPRESDSLPGLLNTISGSEKPGLVITIGFQYTNYTRQLAQDHPDIRFLAIDQSGTGSGTLKAYDITSYGDSYLAGVLAASATKTGRVGIILGMQSDLLDTFLKGYTAGVHAVNASIPINHTYVHQYTIDGFSDPEEAGRIAEGMYRNGTDVIYTCAGYSNTGAIAVANNATGKYIIGTDSDQSPLGPNVVLASAVKRVDRVVSTGIMQDLNGTFTGGEQVAGLKEGVTGLVFNQKFASYNETVNAWEPQAQAGEAQYLLSRASSVQK
jgi:basic membrane protein A